MDAFLKNLEASINKGITFLEQRQQRNGRFICYFSNNDQIAEYDGPEKGWYYEDDIVFPSILIGNSLLHLVADGRVDAIISKVTDFLIEQKRPESVWNHFVPYNWLYAITPFDLDDTSCASALLQKRGVSFTSNVDLIASQRNRQGLFYTFLCLRPILVLNWHYWRIALRELKHPVKTYFFYTKNTEASRYDVDSVVNANVLYYLGETSVTKAVVASLNKIIAEKKEHDCDTWYRNVFTVYYFISRNYHNGVSSLEPSRQPMIDRIISCRSTDGSFGTSALDTALAICSLLNLKYFGPEIKDAVVSLIESQFDNGSWKRCFLYTGGPLLRAGWGSEELNTGFCLEAIARCQALFKQ